MSALMPEPADLTTSIMNSQLAEIRKLRELLGDILDYLERSPDSAVRNGSLLHHAVREASRSSLSRHPIDQNN